MKLKPQIATEDIEITELKQSLAKNPRCARQVTGKKALNPLRLCVLCALCGWKYGFQDE